MKLWILHMFGRETQFRATDDDVVTIGNSLRVAFPGKRFEIRLQAWEAGTLDATA